MDYLNKNEIKYLFNKISKINCNVIFYNSESILFLNQNEHKYTIINNSYICIDLLDYFIKNNDIENKLNCSNIQFSTKEFIKLMVKNCINNNYKFINL